MIYLVEGKSYLVNLTVTNKSLRAGTPVSVILGMSISATTQWTILIPIQTWARQFNAGETKVRTFGITVPWGSAGESGQVMAVVAAEGTKIADVTEYFTIIQQEVITPAFTFSNIILDTKSCQEWWETIIFSCRITNPGAVKATHTIYFKGQYWEYGPNVWEAEKIIESFKKTLGPGEGYNYSYNGMYHNCQPYAIKGYRLHLWLEDELGNKSSPVSITA